jgi:protein-S-isoprenylcysteine O-methyltransferase Ste14
MDLQWMTLLRNESICHDVLTVCATGFEFRYRFFVLAAIFWLGFSLNWLGSQKMTVAEHLARLSGHPTRLAMQIIFGLGAVVIALGAIIRTWATAYLQGEVVHDMALHSERLIADGPYRYTRNPLYLGAILLAVGMSVLASWPGALIIIVGIAIFTFRLIGREEQALSQTQGASFEGFKAAVPRLLPAWSPRLPASGRVPRWHQAWLAESFIWAFALALLCFALTMNTKVLFTMIIGSLFIYTAAHTRNSRKQKRLTER